MPHPIDPSRLRQTTAFGDIIDLEMLSPAHSDPWLLGLVKLGRLPVRIALAGRYMPVHPSNFGQEWNVKAVVAPVIPKLFKGTVF